MSTFGLGGITPSATTFNDGQPTSTWHDPSRPTGPLVSMISALDATMAATDPEYTRPPIALENNPSATANALSILFDALPSAAAVAIASKYNLRPEWIAPQAPQAPEAPQAPQVSQAPQGTSAESEPTPQILLFPSSESSPSPEQNPSSKIPLSTTPSSTTASPTSSTPPSATRSRPPVYTTKPPASEHIKNSEIAGIVSGVIAAVVLLLIAAMFLVRRRQQGKGPFPHKKVYPEVAWLYDPAPTPEGSVHKRDSGQEALLQPRHDEMEQAFLNHPGSPERAQATSPFLVPPRAYGGEESALGPAAWQQGGGTIRAVRRSSASAMVGERPAIFEGPHAR